MMKPLAAHQQGGRGNPNYTGLKRPLSNAVFLCLTKFETVSVRLHSVMAGCIGLPSGRPFQCSVFPHPIQPAANVVENKSSGLHPKNTGVTAMNTQATGEITPQIPLKQTSIADLLIHALQELSHIETLSCLDCDSSCILPSIFQHSQRGLNALHDLKNRLSIETTGIKKPTH